MSAFFGMDIDACAAAPLLADLCERGGLEFAGYERQSLLRRIHDRMANVGVRDVEGYRRLLAADPGEHGRLCEAIPVHLTGFFRDPENWTYLASRAIRDLLAAKPGDEPVRAWSAGCSTDEEAYTLATILSEMIGPEFARERITIFATDVSATAVSCGRAGRYPSDRFATMPDEFRDRYFRREGAEYQVRPRLRALITFGRHDLLRDPPYRNLDIIICRNTMIYFTRAARAATLAELARVLRGGGLLFTGSAERGALRSPLLRCHSQSHGVYYRVGDQPHEYRQAFSLSLDSAD